MLIQGYHPRIGGAERQLKAVAPLLQARGIDVHVITRRYPGLQPYEEIEGIPVHRMPIPRPKPLASLVYTAATLNLIRRLRPQVLHAYELFSPTTTAVAARRLFGIPVAVKILRGGSMGDITRLRQKLMGQRRLEQFRQQVDAFMVISQEIDQELAAAGVPPAKRFFIPNGVDLSRFEPLEAAQKQALRTALELPTTALIGIFTGRLAGEKRLHHLVNAWNRLHNQHPESLLLILGEGEESDRLQQMAGSGVRLLGRVEDVAPYLRAADLFILPSATEGLSNALLEGMASGLLPISTRVGGSTDLIDQGRNGWLVPPDDPAALYETLLLAVQSPAPQRALMAAQARERVMQDYDLSVTAERLQTLYETLLMRQKESEL